MRQQNRMLTKRTEMRGWVVIAIAVAVAPSATAAQSSCLEPAELVRLDAEWEAALLTRDVPWLEEHLAEDFVWVHSAASLIDDKAALLERAKAPASQPTRSRVQSQVEARVLGSTGLVTGFTVVDRGPSPTRFNFMRTYALEDGRCRLLGNHTMVVPDPEGGSGGRY